MPSRGSLVSVLPRVIRLTLCLHLFQVLADALRVNQSIDALFLIHNPIGDEGVKAWWPPRGGELGGPSTASRSNGSYYCKWFHNCSRDGFGTPSRYESRRYKRPSATQRLIVADSLGISFGLCRFLKQQSSALTGSCCRPRSQQYHRICVLSVRWYQPH